MGTDAGLSKLREGAGRQPHINPPLLFIRATLGNKEMANIYQQPHIGWFLVEFQGRTFLVQKVKSTGKTNKVHRYRNLTSAEETQGLPLELVMVNENNSKER